MRGMEMRTGASISSRSVHGHGLALPLRRPTGAQTARVGQNSRQSEYYIQYETLAQQIVSEFPKIASSIERCHHMPCPLATGQQLTFFYF